MHPSRPSSSDPNAPYRAAIAALAGHPIDQQEFNHPQPAPAQYQQNAHEGLPPRRNGNRDHLNQIAHQLGSGVRVAMEIMTPRTMPAATLDVATSSAAPVTVDTIRQYLSGIGHHGKYMADATIQGRLNGANLSTETLLAAIQAAHNPNHPIWAAMGASEFEREAVFSRLSGIVTNKSGFRDLLKTLVRNANNNPEQLIVNLLQYA